MMRGLATLPQDGSRSLQWSRDKMEDPQEDPLAMHCFCVCSGSVLLGDLLRVSRSSERDLPSVLSIYPRIFLCVFIVYRHVIRILCLLYSAICWCVLVSLVLVVSTCQVIVWKDPSENTLTGRGDYLHKAQVEEGVCVYFSFVWFSVFLCVPPSPTQYIFHTPMTWYSLFVLKVSLNTNKTNKIWQLVEQQSKRKTSVCIYKHVWCVTLHEMLNFC